MGNQLQTINIYFYHHCIPLLADTCVCTCTSFQEAQIPFTKWSLRQVW